MVSAIWRFYITWKPAPVPGMLSLFITSLGIHLLKQPPGLSLLHHTAGHRSVIDTLLSWIDTVHEPLQVSTASQWPRIQGLQASLVHGGGWWSRNSGEFMSRNREPGQLAFSVVPLWDSRGQWQHLLASRAPHQWVKQNKNISSPGTHAWMFDPTYLCVQYKIQTNLTTKLFI